MTRRGTGVECHVGRAVGRTEEEKRRKGKRKEGKGERRK
jgi:hypothetical protein